jgi:magnesium chelatase family protein
MRAAVLKARAIQNARNGGPLVPNSRLSGRELDKLAILDEQSKHLLNEAISSMGLSARAYDKIRRVARTIADLEGVAGISVGHIAEAVQYRLLDRQL